MFTMRRNNSAASSKTMIVGILQQHISAFHLMFVLRNNQQGGVAGDAKGPRHQGLVPEARWDLREETVGSWIVAMETATSEALCTESHQ